MVKKKDTPSSNTTCELQGHIKKNTPSFDDYLKALCNFLFFAFMANENNIITFIFENFVF